MALLVFLGSGVRAVVTPCVAAEPPALPEFRALVPEDQYPARRDAALAAAGDLASVAKSAMPIMGARVTRFSADSRAAAAGMTVGSIAYRQDDEPVRWIEFAKYKNENATLWYFDPKVRRVGSAVAVPGSFGLYFDHHWRPDLLYLRRKQRPTAADPHVLVGITLRSTDPNLAETAWRHALAAGYTPDFLSHQCGAEIALAQGRVPEAWAFAAAALAASSGDDEPVYPIPIYRAALANFQLKTMVKLAERYPRMIGADSRSLSYVADQAKDSATDVDKLPLPSVRAATMYRDDLLPRTSADSRNRLKLWLDGVVKENPLTIKGRADSREWVGFRTEEPVRNVEFRVRLKATTAEGTSAYYPQSVYLMITAEEAAAKELEDPREDVEGATSHQIGAGILSLSLVQNSRIGIQHSEATTYFEYAAPDLLSDAQAFHDLRLILVDGRGEILLNGKRLAYVPVDNDDRHRTFYVASSSMTVQIQDVKIAELIERKD